MKNWRCYFALLTKSWKWYWLYASVNSYGSCGGCECVNVKCTVSACSSTVSRGKWKEKCHRLSFD